MSDFDKEAEREKLREKYERDKRDREATQRMSDLLLKGATMTNAHCDVCADPLFRHQETTFCPSCHGGPEGVEASVEPGEPDAGEEAASEEKPSRADATRDEHEPTSTGARGSTSTDDTHPRQRAPTPGDGSEPDSDRVGRRRTVPSTPEAEAAGSRGSAADVPPVADGDLEEANAALIVALERFATAAAETDDPRYAKECLEAAHEAADALRALR